MNYCPTVFPALILTIAMLVGCSSGIKDTLYTSENHIKIPTSIYPLPDKPDYSIKENWSIMGDGVNKKIDVFYIHPTMYSQGKEWLADVGNVSINREVDFWPVRHQASVFKDIGNVYAPRYRQAHFRVFVMGGDGDCDLCTEAVEVAYGDVRESFLFWLQNLDVGKPIVIAGHSQGTLHAKRLLQEFFDGKELGKRLVTSYLLGWGVYEGDFEVLKQCMTNNDINCYCTWMTYATGYIPDWLKKRTALGLPFPKCINPMSWDSSDNVNDCEDHLGVLTEKYKVKYKGKLTGRVHNGLLWLDAPHVFGGNLLHRDNWHSGDYNLFHVNMKENVKERVENFLKDRSNL